MGRLKTLRPTMARLGSKLMVAPHDATAERKAWARPDGGSTTERGYGWTWQQLRERILKRDGHLCRCDDCQGGALRLTVANEVDHIVPKAQGGTDDPGNLRAIGHDCHKAKTAKESAAARGVA